MLQPSSGTEPRRGGFISLRGWLAGGEGDWITTLRTAVTGIERQVDANLSPWPGIFGGAALALAHLGDYESAALLRGFAETNMFWGNALQDLTKEFESLQELLIQKLGADRLAEVAARGTALDAIEAAAYLRAAADKVLDT